MIADRKDKSGYELRVLIHRLTQAQIHRLLEPEFADVFEDLAGFHRYSSASVTACNRASINPSKRSSEIIFHAVFSAAFKASKSLILPQILPYIDSMALQCLYIRLRSGDCVGHLSTFILSPQLAHLRRGFIAGEALSSFISAIGSCLSALLNNTVPVLLLFCESRLTKAITAVQSGSQPRQYHLHCLPV